MRENILIFYLLIITQFIALATDLKVIYPNVNGLGDQHFGYSLLKLALDKSEVPYTLTIHNQEMNNERIRANIKNGTISISDFGTSREFEREFLPIYIPVDMGLNGWRIFLINSENKEKFDRIKNLEDLLDYKAGQGIGWSDNKILRHNRLKVYEAPHIDSLLRMLSGKRIDYFPLGANEVHSILENERKDSSGLIVEESILLIYPFARLFFVRRDNQQLHSAVKTGLERAFNDGSFFELFRSHPANRALFTKANLTNRVQIRIENPYMSSDFLIIPKKYFFTLDMLK